MCPFASLKPNLRILPPPTPPTRSTESLYQLFQVYFRIGEIQYTFQTEVYSIEIHLRKFKLLLVDSRFATGFGNLVEGVGADRISNLCLKLAEGYI